jgi:predicted dehydrogenase
VAARHGAESHFHVPATGDWRNLLGRVDVVSICSPARTHALLVRAFLEEGAHVLVEKPIATDVDEAEELIALAEANDRVLTVGHQERFVFARTGLLDYADAPIAIDCVRTGPWTGRGTDVSVVLDLMIHDLDLMHRLVPGRVLSARARGRSVNGFMSDEVAATLQFENGTEVRLLASRSSELRRRSMRAVYADGEIEIDFLGRHIRNTTGRPLRALDVEDPLAESVADFIAAVRSGRSAMVRPEEARQALETALLIEDAAEPAHHAHTLDEMAAYA